MDLLRTGVLVIGAGAAGLRAALEALRCGAEVTIVSKDRIGRGGATFHPSSETRGMQVSLTPREVDEHVEESLRLGVGADPALVDILCGESKARFQDLLDLGVRFRPERVAGCFSTARRAVVIDSLAQMADRFHAALSGARVIEHAQVTSLVPHGAAVVTRDRRVFGVAFRACVLATGGGAGLFERTLTSPEQVGSGVALAQAPTIHLEFMQIMLGTPPADFFPIHRLPERPAIPGVERDDPAYDRRPAHYPFSVRDGSGTIDIAIARRRGVEVTIDGVARRVANFAHAFNGGLKIDARAETAMPGMFACGEAAGGMHGAERLGGQMLLATQVYGAIAGRHAAAVRSAPEPVLEEPRTHPAGLGLGEIRNIRREVASILGARGMVIRSTAELASAPVGVYEQILRDKPARDAGCGWAHAEAVHAAAFARRFLAACAARPQSLGPHCVE